MFDYVAIVVERSVFEVSNEAFLPCLLMSDNAIDLFINGLGN